MRLLLCAALLGCAACAAPRAPQLLSAAPPQAVGFGALAALEPLAPGQSIRATELRRGESSSVHLVQVRDHEEPHVHTRYDLTVVVVAGTGTLWLEGEPLPMRAGDAAFIPRGTPHYFVNAGTTPAVAMVVFAPAFTDPDTEPAPVILP